MASSAMTLDNATKLVLQLATLMQLKRLNFGLPSAVAVLNQKFRALCANDDISDKSKFYVVFDILKAEILLDPAAHHTPESRNWVEKMLQHNVPHGKLNRGLAVVDSYKHLKGGKITEDEFFLASVLGWAIEWLQACFLVLDDIMDESQTRRGQPCWFRLPWVGNIAVNDGVLLHGHIGRILKRHFYSKHFCADLLDVFNEVGFQTACGQLLDLMTTYEKDLRRCTLPNYLRIVEYKTAYYSFYLPVACALLMAGENLDNHIAVKQILVKMGIYFQVQDDYLDCFGDPKVSGKIGTDIEDFKCSWLLVQALQRADASQLERLNANYGKKDPGCLSDVKALYNELRLQDAFLEYESNSYEELTVAIEEHESEPIRLMLKAFLDKIYKRQK